MTIQPGSISTATLRTQDLIPAFIAALPDDEQRAQYQFDWEAIQEENFPAAGHMSREEAADNLLDDLFDALNEIAPDGCCFGAHPGDGADFGFWPVEDSD